MEQHGYPTKRSMGPLQDHEHRLPLRLPQPRLDPNDWSRHQAQLLPAKSDRPWLPQRSRYYEDLLRLWHPCLLGLLADVHTRLGQKLLPAEAFREGSQSSNALGGFVSIISDVNHPNWLKEWLKVLSLSPKPKFHGRSLSFWSSLLVKYLLFKPTHSEDISDLFLYFHI